MGTRIEKLAAIIREQIAEWCNRVERDDMGRNHQWSRYAIVALTSFVVYASFAKGIELNFDTKVLSPRITMYGIPIAVSQLVYGHKKDFCGYGILGSHFSAVAPHELTNARIQAGCELLPEIVRISGDWLIPADDKGIVSFIYLAFRIFGIELESLYYFFFFIYCASIGLFIIGNWKNEACLLLPFFLTASLYASMGAFPLSDQLGTITEPRFYEFLSLLPTVHVALAMIRAKRAGRHGPAAGAYHFSGCTYARFGDMAIVVAAGHRRRLSAVAVTARAPFPSVEGSQDSAAIGAGRQLHSHGSLVEREQVP